MALKKGNEVATIDVVLVTVKSISGDTEIGLTTSNKIEVTPVTETTDAVKNIVKGVLIAQKPAIVVVTGNILTLTDNVFNAELVKLLQGGKIETGADGKIVSYTPPVIGSSEKGELFETSAYSAIYNAAGVITGYEKCTYPNCQGQPVAFSTEDGAFRAPEYKISSAPDKGEAPYKISYVDTLPIVAEA